MECERFLYSHQTDPWLFYIYYRGGLGHRNLGNYYQSTAWLKKAEALCPIPEFKPRIRYQRALTELMLGTDDRAELEFLMMSRNADSPLLIANAALVQSVLAANGFRWQEADLALDRASFLFGDDSLSAQTRDDLRELSMLMQENPTTVSPVWAKRLSTVIPGLGQLYLGDYTNGLVSMANFGLSTALVYSTLGHGALVEGYFSLSILWLRGFFGSRTAAAHRAFQINDEYSRNAALEFESILFNWAQKQPPMVMDFFSADIPAHAGS